MSPREILFEHRYNDAAQAYEAEIRVKPDDDGLIGGYARTLLCLGNLPDALKTFQRADELAKMPDDPHAHISEIGSVLWLLKRYDEAVAAFRSAVDGVLDGSIKFGDNAGGVSQGLLLWYSGITLKDAAVINHATKYLTRLAKKSRIKNWPGPLALLALGRSSENEILTENFHAPSFENAIKAARTDLLKRRELVQLLFYSGVRARSEGREQDCIRAMRQCAELENPIIENEWYLARGEIGPRD